MIDERIPYYIQGIFLCYLVMYFLFLRKPESNFFRFKVEFETIKDHKKAVGIMLFFFSVVSGFVFWEERDLPAVVNVSHKLVSGTIERYERTDDKMGGGYHIWRTGNHNIILKKDNGVEIKIRPIRSLDMEQGMRIEVRMYDAESMIPVVTKINGQETELYQNEKAVTTKEKTFVFVLYLIMGAMFFKPLKRQYVTIGNRKCGKWWYYGGLASVLLWVIVAAVGIKGEYDALLMGDLLVIANAIIYVCLFRLTWLVHPEDSKRLVEVLKRPYKYRRIIELERMSGIETERYCAYKRKKLRGKLIEFLGLEIGMIWLVIVVYILWDSKWKWIAITAMIVWIIAGSYIKVRAFRKEFSALKKAPEFGLECGRVKFAHRQLRKYQGTDGEIIWRKMKFDDEIDLKNGDTAIVVRAIGTDAVFVEQEKKLSDVLEGRILEEK